MVFFPGFIFNLDSMEFFFIFYCKFCFFCIFSLKNKKMDSNRNFHVFNSIQNFKNIFMICNYPKNIRIFITIVRINKIYAWENNRAYEIWNFPNLQRATLMLMYFKLTTMKEIAQDEMNMKTKKSRAMNFESAQTPIKELFI